MKLGYEKPTVQLGGMDGNAFAVMATIRKAMSKAGATEKEIAKYTKEAMASDYDNLLRVSMDYVEVC